MRWPLKALFLLQTIHVDATIVLQSQKSDENKQTQLKRQLLKRYQISFYLSHCKRVFRLIHGTLLYHTRQFFLLAKRIKGNLASFGDRNTKPACVPQYWHRAEIKIRHTVWGRRFRDMRYHVIWDVTDIWITKKSRSMYISGADYKIAFSGY